MQTGAAKVRVDRIINLCMVTLLVCVSAEYRARREKILQNWRVALLAKACKWRVKRGFESSTSLDSGRPRSWAQRC